MGRIYSCPLEIASAPLVITTDPEQDIWEMQAGNSTRSYLHGFQVTSASIAAEDVELQLCRRTGGGNGTAGVPVKHDTSDATQETVVEFAGLTPGTESDVFATFNWEQLGPLNWLYIPEDRIVADNSTFICLSIMSALAGSVNMSGWITWEEI